MYARPRLLTKNSVANTAVAWLKNEADPREPNTVADAPLPNAAPASAPLPCWSSTSTITPIASSTSMVNKTLYNMLNGLTGVADRQKLVGL
jgi:hypothetical protein